MTRNPKKQKNPAAVALGRLGGLKGGKARAEKLTPEMRKKIARKAATKRWDRWISVKQPPEMRPAFKNGPLLSEYVLVWDITRPRIGWYEETDGRRRKAWRVEGGQEIHPTHWLYLPAGPRRKKGKNEWIKRTGK